MMVIKVEGEHNFFLFQDLVVYFLINLTRQNYLPIKSKYDNNSYAYSSSYYIYKSWLDVVKEKIKESQYSEISKRCLEKYREWMITTNIAILKAQIGRKEIRMTESNRKYIKEEKQSFLIKHSEDYNTYLVHLDGDFIILFNEAVYFWTSFKSFNDNNFYALLKRYYYIEDDIKPLISKVCENYIADENIEYLSTYEIMEEKR